MSVLDGGPGRERALRRRRSEGRSELPLPPARRFAILTCMDARLDPAKYAGLSEGDAHVIRNAGGRASDDAIRSLVISTKLLGTREWFVIHHTDCGMEFFTDELMGDLLASSLETRGASARTASATSAPARALPKGASSSGSRSPTGRRACRCRTSERILGGTRSSRAASSRRSRRWRDATTTFGSRSAGWSVYPLRTRRSRSDQRRGREHEGEGARRSGFHAWASSFRVASGRGRTASAERGHA